MREEQVTKSILKRLTANGWEIVCFDFPQSGTGRMLHPNRSNDEKNKDGIIPDIVAVKDCVCIFAENKDRFFYSDFKKQNMLKISGNYSVATFELLKGRHIDAIFYGIGMPTAACNQKALNAAALVDFIICVDENSAVRAVYNPADIAF